jgi:hypothetical protein
MKIRHQSAKKSSHPSWSVPLSQYCFLLPRPMAAAASDIHWAIASLEHATTDRPATDVLVPGDGRAFSSHSTVLQQFLVTLNPSKARGHGAWCLDCAAGYHTHASRHWIRSQTEVHQNENLTPIRKQVQFILHGVSRYRIIAFSFTGLWRPPLTTTLMHVGTSVPWTPTTSVAIRSSSRSSQAWLPPQRNISSVKCTEEISDIDSRSQFFINCSLHSS